MDNPDFLPVFWLRRYCLVALIWSVLVGGSLAWNLYQENQEILNLSTVMTRANIKKEIGFRKWVNSHGGVYVSPTEHTPPNSYLNIPDRDVVTTTGKALTLMNPAYVLRQLQTDFPDDYGTINHITSLNLLNPANAPDEWETKALKSFDQGGKEFREIQQINGKPYLRMMQPFIVEQGCLKCHAHQGYKIYDVRGGISSSVSLDRFLIHRQEHGNNLWLSHGAIWLIGLAALGISYRRDRRLATERQQSRQRLEDQLDELLRFQKLTVGRELRMKELAEENAALRDQLVTAKPDSARP